MFYLILLVIAFLYFFIGGYITELIGPAEDYVRLFMLFFWPILLIAGCGSHLCQWVEDRRSAASAAAWRAAHPTQPPIGNST